MYLITAETAISCHAFNVYTPTPYTPQPTSLSTNLISNLDAPQLTPLLALEDYLFYSLHPEARFIE